MFLQWQERVPYFLNYYTSSLTPKNKPSISYYIFLLDLLQICYISLTKYNSFFYFVNPSIIVNSDKKTAATRAAVSLLTNLQYFSKELSIVLCGFPVLQGKTDLLYHEVSVSTDDGSS